MNLNMNSPINKETSIIATALMVGLLTLSIVIWTQAGHFIKNQAIDGCYQTGKVQFDKNGQKYDVPENYWYNLCMEKKGYTK